MGYVGNAWTYFAFESILVNIRTTVGYFEYFEVCSEYFIVYWEYFVSTLEYIWCILGYVGYFGSALVCWVYRRVNWEFFEQSRVLRGMFGIFRHKRY